MYDLSKIAESAGRESLQNLYDSKLFCFIARSEHRHYFVPQKQ
jgi:hypothetical protein